MTISNCFYEVRLKRTSELLYEKLVSINNNTESHISTICWILSAKVNEPLAVVLYVNADQDLTEDDL